MLTWAYCIYLDTIGKREKPSAEGLL